MQILNIMLEAYLTGPTLKANGNQELFFREWSPHVMRCHDFPLSERHQSTCS